MNPIIPTPISAIVQEEHVHRILVVDDDLTSRMMLQVILSKEGFRVITASGSAEGRQIAEREALDLILMDVNMPGESGLEACKALKANPLTADYPVIFISALEDVASKVEGFQVGGVDYITKPYNPAEVLARVQLHIRMSHAYRMMVAAHFAKLQALSQSQQILLPSAEAAPNARFAGLYLPHDLAGGDFYDVIQSAEGIYDYLVADVSGHDLGTALPTAALKALLHQNAEMLYSPVESLRLLNRHLRPVLAEGQYATLLYVRLNRARRRMTLLNAGHPPAIWIHAHGGIEIIQQEGDALGLFDAIAPDPLELTVEAGDRVLLYSDGLIEQSQTGPVSRRVGLSALTEICQKTRGQALAGWLPEIVRHILPDPSGFQDDVLALAFDV